MNTPRAPRMQKIELITLDVTNSALSYTVGYTRNNPHSFYCSQSLFPAWTLKCGGYKVFISNCILGLKITEAFNKVFENAASIHPLRF